MAGKTHKPIHERASVAFVRVGGQLVNLAHVMNVLLPVEGDPKQPLTFTFVNGVNLQLVGDDAETALEALGECCDVDPAKPDKHK